MFSNLSNNRFSMVMTKIPTIAIEYFKENKHLFSVEMGLNVCFDRVQSFIIQIAQNVNLLSIK